MVFFVRYSCILRLKSGKVSRRAVFLTTDGGTSITMACLSPDVVVLLAEEGWGVGNRARFKIGSRETGQFLNCIFFYFGTCCEVG